MAKAEPSASIRRILVALDTSPEGRASLATAIELAAALGAELRGLFVMDATLQSLADLGVVQQVRLPSGRAHPLQRAEAELQLRAEAQRVRRLFEDAAQKARVASSFHTVLGDVCQEVAKAAEEVDLLALGSTGTRLTRRGLGSTARRALALRRTLILIERRARATRRPLAVLWEDNEIGRRALQVAVALATRSGRPLEVLVQIGAEDAEAPAALRQQLEELDRGGNLPDLRVTPIDESGSKGGSRALASSKWLAGGWLVIVPVGGERLDEDAFEKLVEEAESPILAVR